MATVAELRMDVDSRSVRSGTASLSGLDAAATRAEAKVVSLGVKSRQAGQQVGSLASQAKAAGSGFKGLAGELTRFTAGVLSFAAAARGLNFLSNAADQFRALDNRIRLVTDSAEEFTKVQQGLIGISRETFATIDATVQGYQRMSAASERLGISQERLLGITKTVNQAVALSGATTQAAEASLIQFGQALSNNFQASAQEINSINEQVFALGDAIARGLTITTGVETFRSDLKKLAEEGKLTAEGVIRALEAVGPEIEGTFAGLQRTRGQIETLIAQNIKVLADAALGPITETQIGAYRNIAEALASPEALERAKAFGASVNNIAKGIIGNFDAIAKAGQGIAAALAFSGVVAAINAVRGAVLALNVAMAANPVGLLVTALGLAIGLIVTFRDEITRALTPFEDFNELAEKAGPIFKGAFAVIGDAANTASDVFVGFAAVVRDLLDDITAVLDSVPGLKSARESLQNRPLQTAGNAFSLVTGGVNPVRDIGFGLRALEARGQLEAQAEAARKAQVETLKAANENNKFIGVVASLDSELSGLAGTYADLGGAITVYGASTKTATAAIANQNTEIGKVQQSLLDQLSAAQRLAEAAKVGPIRFETEASAVKLDELARKAVAQAKEAKEELSFTTARAILEEATNLENAAKAMLDAEKQLRERASARAGELAAGISTQLRDALASPTLSLLGNSPSDIAAFAKASSQTIQGLRDFLESDATIGIDADTLFDLKATIDEAAKDHGLIIRDAIHDGAMDFKAALSQTTANILDKLIFEGGRGFGQMFEGMARNFANDNLFKPFGDVLSGKGSFADIGKGLKDTADNFSKAGKDIASSIDKSLANVGSAIGSGINLAMAGFAGFNIGKGISNLVGITGNPKSVAAGGALGGLAGAGVGVGVGLAGGAALGAAIGSVVPVIGTIIGAALGAILGGAFSKPSQFAATSVFSPSTGKVFGEAQRDQSEASKANASIRDAVSVGISDITQVLASLTGATTSALLNVTVGNRRGIEVGFQGPAGTPVGGAAFEQSEQGAEAAIRKGVELTIGALQGGQQALVDFAKQALAAGQSVDEIVSVLGALANASATGVKILADYALVAAKAGRSAESITAGVNAIANVLKFAEKPLSDVAKSLKEIDDAVNPVIEDLKSLGQSFSGIAQIGKDAATALGRNFLDGIRDLNLELKNKTLSDYKSVLDEIAQRQNDAFALFQRGAISQSDFDFVQSTGGLQAAQFFKTLPDEERDSLARFLGLLGEVSGDIAVARARLEEQFDYLIDNVEETAKGFEEAAENFDRLGKGLRDTAERIRTEFSGLTPRANTDELLGRVNSLLIDARTGNTSALEALPQVVTSLIEKARQSFGGTTEFARIRDIGLAALDEAASVSERLASENFTAAQNARTDVELLADIRNLIDDDRQLNTLQSILDEGKLTNRLIADQLRTFLGLFNQGGRPANEVSIDELQGAAQNAILVHQANSVQAPVSVSGASTSASPITSQTQTSAVSEAQIVQVLSDQAAATDRNAAAIDRMEKTVDQLAREIRRSEVRRQAV